MSPSHVLEPTYRRLKHGLMNGLWSPGNKLEATKLADEFGVSMTPVRDSLNRLAGEKLVEVRPGEGYRVPRLSEGDLRDLLEVNLVLLVSAIEAADPAEATVTVQARDGDPAGRIAATFVQIAARSRNTVLADLVQCLGERLHAVRRIEPEVLPGSDAELDTIGNLARARDPTLASVVRSYHRRRQAHSADFVRALEGRS